MDMSTVSRRRVVRSSRCYRPTMRPGISPRSSSAFRSRSRSTKMSRFWAGCDRACRLSRQSTQGRFRSRRHPGGHHDRLERTQRRARCLPEDLDCRQRRVARCVPRRAQHPDHQRLAALYRGGIGTGGVYGTWISTAYLIGEIIVIPMTDFLSRVFSLRRYLIANTALFLLFSALCGQASSLGEMIVFRILQGFTGGVMIPLAFTIVLTMLPRSKHALGFAGFAVTATFAPAIGPTIGGYFTDNYGWPYVFYVNLVPGAVMLGALWYALPGSAMQLGLFRRGDWRGVALMALGLAAFQTVLDDGNVYDWFGSPFIVKLSLVAAVAIGAFVVLEFVTPEPLINFRLLGRRNFGLGTLGNFLL